jgi:hypothetical protein
MIANCHCFGGLKKGEVEEASLQWRAENSTSKHVIFNSAVNK